MSERVSMTGASIVITICVAYTCNVRKGAVHGAGVRGDQQQSGNGCTEGENADGPKVLK